MGEPWNTILTIFGPSGFLLCVALYTVVRGDWIPKKSHDQTLLILETGHSRELAILKEAHASAILRLEQANADWRQIAMHGLDAAEEAALVGKVLVAGTKSNRR